MPMKFGPLLSLYREGAGFNQKDLASLIPINQSYLSRIERGRRKPPQRELIINIGRSLNLEEEKIDELLIAANYHPQTLFDLGFNAADLSIKNIIATLAEIKSKSQLATYLKAKDEIFDYLQFLKLKYTQRVDRSISKNTLLAELIYSKVKHGGMSALYEFINNPLGGAVIIMDNKILLYPLGKGAYKNAWFIPSGFVNKKKGDKTAQDITMRVAKKKIGDIELNVVRELTAPGEPLDNLDTVEHCVKIGILPFIAQIYEIKVKNPKKIKLTSGARFVSLNDIPKLEGDFYPLLEQIVRPYIRNKKILKQIYLRQEETIRKMINKKNYYDEMSSFYNTRIKKEA